MLLIKLRINKGKIRINKKNKRVKTKNKSLKFLHPLKTLFYPKISHLV